MYDEIPPERWVEAMAQFANDEVEFYMWGGEPFCVDGTFDVVKGFAEYDFVQYARIDTNISAAKKIVTRCPSEKIKINASWHTEYFGYEQMWKNVMLPREQNMIAMVNFVASDANVAFIEKEGIDLDDLIARFEDHGMYLNVAADFHKGSDPEYRDFMLKYMPDPDWEHIHHEHPPHGVACNAAEHFFWVGLDGELTTCGAVKTTGWWRKETGPEVVGNFLEGVVKPQVRTCPQTQCPSIIGYHQRKDNDMSNRRHLEDYVARGRKHRLAVSGR
jgi:hypothetical protein